MRLALKLAGFVATLACSLRWLSAQDLAPRAFVITPLHSNAVTLTWSIYDGSINYNGALPVADANGTYSVPIISYYPSFDFFGRSANVVASLSYGVGNFEGTVSGAGQDLYRSGLLDSVFRVSVNLKGGPAMPVQIYMKWKQKVLLGASLKVIAPTGQYDPTKLINWGANRWSFKTGVWLFATLGQMGARWVHGSVVLHQEFRFLVAQHLLFRDQVSVAKSNRRLGRAPELRLQAAALGLA